MRSVWKGKYQFNKIKYYFNFFLRKKSYIFMSDVGLKYKIYNGKDYINVLIKEGMVGKKFGNFVLTKILGRSIHLKKKKKLKK